MLYTRRGHRIPVVPGVLAETLWVKRRACLGPTEKVEIGCNEGCDHHTNKGESLHAKRGGQMVVLFDKKPSSVLGVQQIDVFPDIEGLFWVCGVGGGCGLLTSVSGRDIDLILGHQVRKLLCKPLVLGVVPLFTRACESLLDVVAGSDRPGGGLVARHEAEKPRQNRGYTPRRIPGVGMVITHRET